MFQVLTGFHESGRHRIQRGVVPCRIVLDQQAVGGIDHERDHRWFDAREQQSTAMLLVGAPLRPTTHGCHDGRPAGRAAPLSVMPHAQRHRTGGLTGLTGVGVWGETPQVHPVEPLFRLLQDISAGLPRHVVALFRDGSAVARKLPVDGAPIPIVAIAVATRGHDMRDIHRDHMSDALGAGISAEEHGHRLRVPFQGLRHVCAG